jgi:histidine triad (HIT) family protein
MDCVFCQIASAKIPAHVVHEDEHVLALMDNGRNTLG